MNTIEIIQGHTYYAKINDIVYTLFIIHVSKTCYKFKIDDDIILVNEKHEFDRRYTVLEDITPSSATTTLSKTTTFDPEYFSELERKYL